MVLTSGKNAAAHIKQTSEIPSMWLKKPHFLSGWNWALQFSLVQLQVH